MTWELLNVCVTRALVHKHMGYNSRKNYFENPYDHLITLNNN